MTKRKKQASKKKLPTPFIIRALKWLIVAGLWGGIFLAGLVLWYAQDLPDIASAPQFERRLSITIKGADGSVLTRYGDIKAESIGVEELPSHLIYAIIATEDRRFYQHGGIDPAGMARAMGRNLISGRVVQGGSTITQQLAKNLFLSHERTLKRKIQEAMLALWLEKELTKDEILSAYLNRVYLGSGAYGVEAASQLYFGKSARDVNLRESSLLAGLLKAPSRYSPLRNPDLAMERANVVLKAMADAGYITQKQAEELYDVPPAPRNPLAGSSIRYFGDWVIDQLDNMIGTPQQDLVIETTFVPGLQVAAQQEVSRVIDTYGAQRKVSQGAALVLRPTDGAILAMVGGKDFGQSQFNRTTQALRPPGSAFKPIVFTAALESGLSPDTLVLDAPFPETDDYRPENFGNEYLGPTTMEMALVKSLNTATVRIAQEIGIDKVIDVARDLGITSELHRDLSLALGSNGITMMEMAAAYASIADDGHSVRPYAITRITDTDGQVYYERPRWRSSPRVIDRQSARQMDGMLHHVVTEGTGRGAADESYDAAGKTGTSQDSRDAWFIGYTDKIVAAVWLGNDDNSPMDAKDVAGVTGGSYPAQIWRGIARAAHGQVEIEGLNPAVETQDDGIFEGLLGRLLSGPEPAPEPYEEPEKQNSAKPQYND